jgi:hypothetical protein
MNKNRKPRGYYSLNKDEATVVWVIIMLVGTIFKGNWMIWILATAIWWNYIKD